MEKLSGKYAVFLDIDGTIMGKCDKALEKNLNVIQKVRSLGHRVFINTGRSTAYIPLKLDVNKNFDGVISGDGAIAKVGENVLFKKLMPYEAVKKACSLFLNLDCVTFLEGEEKIYYFSTIDNPEKTWIQLDERNVSREITPQTPIEKFTVLGKIPQEVLTAFKDDCSMLQHLQYGEIIRTDISKALAMQDVMAYLKMPMQQCIAVGDSLNDYDMLSAAGIGVAMGNSVEEIKAVADYQTSDVDSAGVAEFLQKMFDLR